VNAKKRDTIPLPVFMDKRSDAIVNYWDRMYEVYPRRFSHTINPVLTGLPDKMPGWQTAARERPGEKCDYHTKVRGSAAWSR